MFQKILSLPRQPEGTLCCKVGGILLDKTKRFAYTCVRKRRKFSEDARKPSGSHVKAWAALSYIFSSDIYDGYVSYLDFRYTPTKSYKLSEVQLKYDKKNKTISLKSSPKNFTEKIIKSDFVKLEPHNGRYELCARLETKNYVVIIGEEYTYRDSWFIERYECKIRPKSYKWSISKGSPGPYWFEYEESLNKTKE